MRKKIRLEELLKDIQYNADRPIAGVVINSLCDDSRLVRRGDSFIACQGSTVNGDQFISSAIENGAKVVIAENKFDAPPSVLKVLVPSANEILPTVADNYYGRPAEKMFGAGVTGTNGKTTITYLIEHMMKTARIKTGVVGTINYRWGKKVIEAKNTTPGVLELRKLLAAMADDKTAFLAMEVSSHSLDQGRVDGIGFDMAIMTNITQDHLDYHKTIKNYIAAKGEIFKKLKPEGVAGINIDDARVDSFRDKIRKNRIITYGMSRQAMIRVEDLKLSIHGSEFTLITPKYSFHTLTPLIGMHNVSNILAAVSVGYVRNLPPELIESAIKGFRSIPGRLESIDEGQPFKTFVDFAHTEDALRNVLGILHKTKPIKLITVFGCGGNRDAKKRPLMGRVACELSTHAIITSDNPRREDPLAIIDDILAGVKDEFSNYSVVADRREAIRKALGMAGKDDIVLIAGKGHEKYQIVGNTIHPFDDCDVVKDILKDPVFR